MDKELTITITLTDADRKHLQALADYYNSTEGGEWTVEKAAARIFHEGLFGKYNHLVLKGAIHTV